MGLYMICPHICNPANLHPIVTYPCNNLHIDSNFFLYQLARHDYISYVIFILFVEKSESRKFYIYCAEQVD